MEATKQIIRRSFWWILLWCVCLCAGLYAAFYVMTDVLADNLMALLVADGDTHILTMADTAWLVETFRMAMAPVMIGSVAVFAVLLWITLRMGQKKLAAAAEKAPQKKDKAKKEPQKPEKSLRERQLDEQRQTLHLLAILQRGGRLMDFFAENLDDYEDAQIGAAVRGVHESCVKLLQKHIRPGPVMDQEEGSAVTVEAGFDPSAIKLTGNVSGEPPFTGVLRHRGWRAAKYDMPSLVSQADPRLIAPAEVEIE